MAHAKQHESPAQARDRGLNELEPNAKRDDSDAPSVIENHEPHLGSEPGETPGAAHRDGTLPNLKR